MAEPDEPFAHEYLQGRQAGLAGAERDTNPYFARENDEAGVPESHELWRTRYDVWRQGWIEGHSLFELQ